MDHKLMLEIPVTTIIDLEKDSLVFPIDGDGWAVQCSFMYSIPRHPIMSAVLRLQTQRGKRYFYPPFWNDGDCSSIGSNCYNAALEVTGPRLFYKALQEYQENSMDISDLQSYLPSSKSVYPRRDLHFAWRDMLPKYVVPTWWPNAWDLRGYVLAKNQTQEVVVEEHPAITLSAHKALRGIQYRELFNRRQIFCHETGPQMLCGDDFLSSGLT